MHTEANFGLSGFAVSAVNYITGVLFSQSLVRGDMP